MVRINLRDYYSFYKSDFFIETTNEILELFKQLHRKEHADFERRRIHNAYYSLDVYDGIEKDIILLVISPEEIYEQKISNQKLYAVINNLPEKQAKRVYAHFFLGMSKAEIAKTEGVRESTIWESIERGLRNIEKFLKRFF